MINYIRKNFDRITVWNLLSGLIICLVTFMYKESYIKIETNNIIYILVNVFSNFNLESNDFMEYVMYISNYTLVLYIFGTYIADEFNENSIYIFTRTDNVTRWIHNKIKRMILLINYYFIIEIISVLIFCKLQHFIIYDVKKTLVLLISMYINLIIQTSILVLLSNIISLKYGSLIGYLFTFAFFSFSIVLSYIFKVFKINYYLRFVPFISSITGWYGSFNWILDRNQRSTSFYISDYNFECNLVFNILVLFILIFFISKYAENKEII